MIRIYKRLLNMYGPQGWWPIISHKGNNPTKTGSIDGYHPRDYNFPRNKDEQFEICIGAILTQNTAWPNVEKALINLKNVGALNIKGIKKLSEGKLRELIRPAGYFNQKSTYIRDFVKFYEKNPCPTREQLLDVKGIGPETADSMLLFAFRKPEFVIDAYTKRIFDPKARYEELKQRFESGLKKDLIIFQEFHALIVEHAKRYYNKKPCGEKDPLRKMIKEFSWTPS